MARGIDIRVGLGGVKLTFAQGAKASPHEDAVLVVLDDGEDAHARMQAVARHMR